MKFLALAWAGVLRNPVRSGLTFCSIVLAFALFSVVQGTSSALDRIVDRSGGVRLRVTSRVNVETPLPLAYRERIEQLAGVNRVTHFTWMPAFFQDLKNGITTNAIDPPSYFAIFREWEVDPAAQAAMLRTRQGAIVGEQLAAKYAWKVGDHVPLISPVWQQRDSGSGTWVFEVVGLYRSSLGGVPSNQFFVNYSYFDEARGAQNGTVAQFAVEVANPAQASRTAQAIDELFDNSSAATFTQDESDWLRSNVDNIDNISAGVKVVVSAVLFTLLTVIGITMLQSIRDRIPEFGVLKALGFPSRLIVVLIVTESLALALPGAAIGSMLAIIAFPRVFTLVLDRTVPLPLGVIVQGLVLSALMALASSALPAWRVHQLGVVAALSYRGGRP